jgi:CubicO group peptidase (beta-lactamase class C family)
VVLVKSSAFVVAAISGLVIALYLQPAISDAKVRHSTQCLTPNGDLHEAVVEIHEKQKNIGVVAVISKQGELVFSDFLGFADIEHQVPISGDTRLGIASITKLFTAVMVLKLKAAQLVDLDSPVQRYVAAFPKKPEGEITIRMLLEHRSGIPHPQAVRTPKLFATHYETATDALEVFADEPLSFPPGTDSAYSSSNYNLLAAVIEQITGKKFTDVVKGEIFNPLEMTHTDFDNVLRTLPDRARRYSYYRPWTYEESEELFVVPSWDYSFNTGGGNIISTAADLSRFANALMQPGLLNQQDLDLLYGENLFGDVDSQGQKYIYASGANQGLQAGLTIFPGSKTAAVVLSNTWGIGSRSAEMTRLSTHLTTLCNEPEAK